jgi:L-rhamnose-H+ transport protein
MEAQTSWVAGLTLVLAAGGMQGAFPLPMRFARTWQWENIWFVASLAGLVLLPWAIAFRTVPATLATVGAVSGRDILLVALFGAGWGVGGLLFGLGVHRVGLSITTAIVIGLTSTVGSLLPLALWNPGEMTRRPGLLAIGSVAMTLCGLILCSVAGYRRERVSQHLDFRRGSYWSGVAICILSGLLSPLFNFALICGAPLVRAAERVGARAVDGPNLVLAVAMTAGMIPTAVYCGWLMRTRATVRCFVQRGTGIDLTLAVVMGMLFAFGNSLYGMGAESMGPLGPALGWPVFMAVQVLTGNVLAVMTGEWKGTGSFALVPLAAGNAALVAAVVLVAPFNR